MLLASDPDFQPGRVRSVVKSGDGLSQAIPGCVSARDDKYVSIQEPSDGPWQ